MLRTLEIINLVIGVVFTLCYLHQFFYILVPWIRKRKKSEIPAGRNKIAVLICARNEEVVISGLIDSIHAQTYPAELIDIFVLADNCTDHTADIAASHGAHVYSRFNDELIGKGYAMKELRQHINEDYPDGFDAYIVVDADNILSPNYVEEMNRTLSEGNHIITSYRNSKNFGDNWVSSGYALWFIRESRYLNDSRDLLGISCAVSGTGFLFDRTVADRLVDWPYHCLTEDIEFTIDAVLRGERIAFCPNAELYDEQPTSFRQSWNQRKRWTRGYLQVFRKYGTQLLKGIFVGKHKFSCYDMTMNNLPAFFLSTLSLICNIALIIAYVAGGLPFSSLLLHLLGVLVPMYFLLVFLGAVPCITEWKHIHTSTAKKILAIFTFPLFPITFLPIAISSLFGKVVWKPIKHTVTMDGRKP